MPASEIIYTQETVTWTLRGVALTTADVAAYVTTATSFAYVITNMDGTSVASGSMTYIAASNGDWYCTFDTPSTAGEYHCHATVVKSGSTGKHHDKFSTRTLF